MPGTVVTFYSYKGGVGRSFTLANIAMLLANWGYRVLCVDWDLEAPGLHMYFRPMMSGEPSGGVLDLVDDFLARRPCHNGHIIPLSDTGELDLLAAGRQDSGYARRVQEIDWARLYDDGFAEYLEACREQWITEYDYVLLDSRTGISDIGSICTAHLPDQLVVLFTANLQSVRGAVEIANRANISRDGLPYDRSQLTVLPVLSRFDTREEYDRAETWRRTCVEETRSLFRNWLHRDVEPDLVARHFTLPYVSYWSFGEQLPVQIEHNPAADQISFALETVAAVVAHRFERTELLAENRDAYVTTARPDNREYAYDVRVSAPRSMLAAADTIIHELTDLGLGAERSLSGDRSLLTRVTDNARHLCLLIDGKVSRWQEVEVELFLRGTLGQDRRLIPVLTADTEPNTLPGYVSNLRYLRLDPVLGVETVARELAAQLYGVSNSVGPDRTDLLALLRQADSVALRPRQWEIVDEIVHELAIAVGTGNEQKRQVLADDLALVIRPSPGPHEPEQRMAIPLSTWMAITEVTERLLSNGAVDRNGSRPPAQP